MWPCVTKPNNEKPQITVQMYYFISQKWRRKNKGDKGAARGS